MVEDGREWFGEYSGTAAGVICTHAAQALLPQPTHPAPQPPRRLEFPAGTIPIVFYVHSRPEYFEQSMAALASAAGVSDTIIVISHDGLYPEMDAIVDRLSARLKLASHGKHAGVYQLVHNQCEDSDRNAARYHGHDKVLKVKAHWWWMMVRPIDCFDSDSHTTSASDVRLLLTCHVRCQERVWGDLLPDSYNGPALFLEEDHVLSPDALPALRAMINAGISDGCHTVSRVALRCVALRCTVSCCAVSMPRQSIACLRSLKCHT